MGLSRRRDNAMIWPGFVDAVTTLLMVLMFVLTIFTVMQSVLRETITTQGSELDALTAQVAGLADALGLERDRTANLQAEIGTLTANLTAALAEGDRQAGLVASLTGQLTARVTELDAATGRIASFEAQVASLLADRDSARGEAATLSASLGDLQSAQARLITEKEALDLALAKARTEIDAGTEAARLAAARRAALEALIADMQQQAANSEVSLTAALTALQTAEARAAMATEAELKLAAEQGAAAALRLRLDGVTSELTELEKARLADLTVAQALRLRLDSATSELAELEKVRLADLAATEALQAQLNGATSELTEAEKVRLADIAVTEALRARLEGVTNELTESEKARLADLAAAEALRARLDGVTNELTAAEKTRLADLAAAEVLRARLASADDELIAMTLALEEQRKRAEETLTLLAAADAARDANADKAILLETAHQVLTQKDQELVDAAQRMAALNQQIAALRGQLGSLQEALNASAAKDAEANVLVNALGGQLNAALARVAAEEKRRAELEEAERKRLEAENLDLAKFRSNFFAQLSTVLAGREGVRVVGDRFVFSSEVLFQAGSADLAPEGKVQIAGVVQTLIEVADQIPPGIDWVIRVDGHTDAIPLSGSGAFADNWELSQARALSVVRFMQNVLGFPPERMAATGFGEYRPVAEGNSPEALAANRRIELKLTER